ncbi:MAG: hypothetical protein PF542_04925 [Nanoarchaeota archaeon]|jgi:hypothetical protein|nr:hypothetical protein [Nanoarchaeota archaeon]
MRRSLIVRNGNNFQSSGKSLGKFTVRKMISGKKGGDKIISLYWFVILTLIAGGVVLMTNAFYGKPYDVRNMESEILANKAADCVYSGGKFNPELFSDQGTFKGEFKDKFLSKCNLNFKNNKEFEEEQYYLKVEFFEYTHLKEPLFFLEGGNQNYLSDCKIKERSKNLPVCLEASFYVNDLASGAYLVKITSIVSKTEQNVK